MHERQRLQAHLKLLQQHDDLAELHEVQTTPIFTEPVREHAVSAVSGRQSQPFTQFGLLAGDISTPETAAADPRVFYNVAAPSSVFICGSQGSGKSHSLSCLLENCLLQTAANELPRPLTGLLFHYDSFISDTGGSPCEAAWLSTHRNVSVRVLCPPSNIATMQKLYRRFPRITVEELRLSQADLNTKRMLDLMAVSHSNTMPLYLHVVNRVLRDLRTSQQRSGSTFDYTMFKQLLMAEKLSPDQKNPLQQRLETLESFMLVSEAKAFDMFTQGQQVKQVKQVQQATRANQRATDWTPRPGQLTILDLSCPTVTAETACSLFHICLSLFLEQKSSVGRVIALDEAHKYMTGSDDSKGLTESLLTIIRMQRHLGARVFISTQEPTINPKLIDLCSISLVHRFTSPDWLNTLRKHLAGGSSTSRLLERAAKVGGAAREEATQVGEYRGLQGLAVHSEEVALELFAKIVNLRVGEALLFAPSGIIGLQEAQQACSSPSFRRLADGVLKVRIRHRTTGDGGRSIMAD
ncbi:hypothetical protein P8C59_006038 [Phyllachora maydis]|uniref:Uncharacterized protein n=1 Tax=Phyllachora maydis TaxID=1825666 RepID=A0AAD9I7B0_9PEZI|nr:hypothetical protein P8C59_006038 [Phyllachora maydis]